MANVYIVLSRVMLSARYVSERNMRDILTKSKICVSDNLLVTNISNIIRYRSIYNYYINNI